MKDKNYGNYHEDDVNTSAFQGAGQLRSHHLDDESHPQTKHLTEEFRLSADEHGQVHKDLLRISPRNKQIPLVYMLWIMDRY